MKVVTWNVNSLNARREFVELYLDAEEPDVLCIQELKLDTGKVPLEIFESRGYHVAIHGQPKWNGVLIASKQPLENVHMGLPDGDEGQSRLIAATTGGIRFVNLYCPQGSSVDSEKFPYKLGFYDALIDWVAANNDPSDPLVILGDLNVAPKPDDVWDLAEFENVPTYHPLEHERWVKLIEWGLTDVVYPLLPSKPKERFSFWDYRGMAFRFNKGMRIDHILATAPLVDRIESARVVRDWRKKKEGMTASDHAPVEAIIGG
jgi:exodeoxyribonuclease-3